MPCTRFPAVLRSACAFSAVLALAGCATRSVDVAPAPASPLEFLGWDCARIDDELDLVQQRAADVAYAVDERAGNNIIALGVGVTVFWPAMLAMRSNGLEAAELGRLKGRFEALRTAAQDHQCPPAADELPAARAAGLPLALGERLVYEDRYAARGAASEWALQLTALRRGDSEYRSEAASAPTVTAEANGPPPPPAAGAWKQDHSGNMTAAPKGALLWPHLLRGELALGAVTAGDILVSGDPQTRARMRGQVVAVGAQTVAGRRFDVAVVELFGDAERGNAYARVDGVIVVDRRNGVLLRLDLHSPQPAFSIQRRLSRVEPAPG